MRFISLTLVSLLMLPLTTGCEAPPPEQRVKTARQNSTPTLGRHFGKPVFIRIIKEDYEFELYVQEPDHSWQLVKTYEIAGMSGDIGPKTREGDEQAPEGFYRVLPGAMNPRSNYHLSFNIGYPNAYDRALGRTGSYIMVHGSDVSIGCFAMTDPGIEEIYTLVNEAFKAGVKSVPVQIYPFRMTKERMAEEAFSEHHEFWRHLQPGWEYTEQHGAPYDDSDSRLD